MALQVEKLTALGVAKQAKPGYYNDGAGLYLQVSPSGSKSWVFRFKLSGRPREMGLGSLHAFSLAEARQRAKAARQLLADGVDPIEARDETKLARALRAAKAVTFRAECEAYIESERAGWKNVKHAAQWSSTLATYAYPTIGQLDVSAVDTALVVGCLRPIWTTKTETATRLRGRIEKVLDFATAQGHRIGNNPARWRGHLEAVLPAPGKVAKVVHHSALPYAEAAAFLMRLRSMEGTGARALEFTMLTTARSGEVRGATWSEIDMNAAVWTIPGARMKMGREHRVPLSAPALKLLAAMPRGESDFVFAATRGGQLSDMTLSAVMRRMKVEAVPHGLRSTFRDWAAEQTNFPREVAEAALAHALEDRVEAAYRRGDLFEKRSKLMQAWADYCCCPSSDAHVIPMKNRAGRPAAKALNREGAP